MAVSTRLTSSIVALESITDGLGLATNPHRFEYPPATVNSGLPDFATGTGDNTFDLVYSASGTLTATTLSIDLYGSLVTKVTGAVSFVEVCGIFIMNTATAAASRLIVGNGTNPAYSGLFGGAAHTVTVPASGKFEWFAPLDGGGLTVTNTSADVLKLDSGAATIPYKILILGRSA